MEQFTHSFVPMSTQQDKYGSQSISKNVTAVASAIMLKQKTEEEADETDKQLLGADCELLDELNFELGTSENNLNLDQKNKNIQLRLFAGETIGSCFDWRLVAALRYGTAQINKDMKARNSWKLIQDRTGFNWRKIQPIVRRELLKCFKKESEVDLRRIIIKQKPLKQLFTYEQLQSLIKQEMLEKLATFSIHQRCVVLLRNYGIYVKPHQLRRIYRQNKIKKKKIGITRPLQNAKQKLKRFEEAKLLLTQLPEINEKGIKLYMIDEVIFTAKDYCKQAWSNLNKNISVKHQYMPPCVAAFVICDNKQIILFKVKEKSIKEQDFQQYIVEFRYILGHRRKVALLMDNLSFHRNMKSNYLFDQNNILPIRLIAYHSQFNSIEFIFGLAKNKFRKELLKKLQEDPYGKLDLEQLVQQIFEHLVIPKTFMNHCKLKQKGLFLRAQELIKEYLEEQEQELKQIQEEEGQIIS